MMPALRSGCERIPTMPAAFSSGEQAVERNVEFVRQFEQDVPAVIGQRENFALPDQSRSCPTSIRTSAPGSTASGISCSASSSDNSLGPLADRVAVVLGKAAQLMRRDDDRVDAVGHRHARHGQRLVPALGAVVDARQQMAVNVDETGSLVHARPVLNEFQIRALRSRANRAAAFGRV